VTSRSMGMSRASRVSEIRITAREPNRTQGSQLRIRATGSRDGCPDVWS